MNDEQVMHALGIDEGYDVDRVLASGPAALTERVSVRGYGPFVRKKIPLELANRMVWAALADCTCPRLPQVAATYEMPDTFAVVYDYVPGVSLGEVVRRNGRLNPSEAVQVVVEVCEALSDLHEHLIVHRDITPSNIVVAADGAHLIDFGIAQVVGQTAEKDAKPLGTWGFAAPEQFFGKVDPRSDVYAAGCLLGHLLTGLSPDDEGYKRCLADSRLVPQELRVVVERACEFEPSARYQQVEELAHAARVALGGAGAHTPLDARDAVSVLTAVDDALTAARGAQTEPDEDRPTNVDAVPHARCAEPRISSGAVVAGCAAKGSPGSADSSAEDGADCSAGRAAESGIGSAHGNSGEDPVDDLADAVARKSAERPSGEPSEKPGRSLSSYGVRRIVLLAATFCATLATIAAVFMAVGGIGGVEEPSKEPATVQEDERGPQDARGDYSVQDDGGPDAGSMSVATDQVANPIEVVDSGYTVIDGYAYYAVALRNTSETEQVDVSEFSITGRDEDGGVVFSETQAIGAVPPGETVWFSLIAGDGHADEAATIEFTPLDPGDYAISTFMGEMPVLSVDGVRVSTDSLGFACFTGEVTLAEGEYPSGSMGQVLICVVLRDAGGNIVYGCSGFASQPEVGEKVPFSIDAMSDLPSYETVEVHAQSW